MNGMLTLDVSKNEMLVGMGIWFFETTPKQTLEDKNTLVTCRPTTLKKWSLWYFEDYSQKESVELMNTHWEKREKKKSCVKKMVVNNVSRQWQQPPYYIPLGSSTLATFTHVYQINK